MSTRGWVILFVAIALLLLGIILLRSNSSSLVGIWQDGELLYTIDPWSVTEPYEILLFYEAGHSVVQVDRGTVRISYADCPTKECVKQGVLMAGGGTIVCLPNRIVIGWMNQREAADAVSR